MEKQQKFTAEVDSDDDESVVFRWDGPDGRRVASADFLSQGDAAEFVALINAPAASPGVLPEGIEAVQHRLNPNHPVPDGWRRCGEYPQDLTAWTCHSFVERVPVPETEKVDWRLSIGRTLPDGREVTGAWLARGIPQVGVLSDSGYAKSNGVPAPDADGLVSVLVEGDR